MTTTALVTETRKVAATMTLVDDNYVGNIIALSALADTGPTTTSLYWRSAGTGALRGRYTTMLTPFPRYPAIPLQQSDPDDHFCRCPICGHMVDELDLEEVFATWTRITKPRAGTSLCPGPWRSEETSAGDHRPD